MIQQAPIQNLIFALAIVAITFIIGVWKNTATAFAWCFLPATLLGRAVMGYMLRGGFPDMRLGNAALIGVLGAMLFRFWTHPKIRWSPVDFVVLLAPVVAIASAIDTENLHTGHDEFLKQLLGWLLPYFVARYSFYNEEFRKNCLRTLIPAILILAAFAFVEFRLLPHAYGLALRKTGLGVTFHSEFLHRGAFFRAETAFGHAIFFGDVCLSVFFLIILLGSTVKGGWKRPVVLLGAAAALLGLATSMSFGPLLALAFAGGIFVLLRSVSIARGYAFFVGTTVVVSSMIYFSVYLATTPVPPMPKTGSMYDSFIVRWIIVQNCAPFAEKAGPLGVGKPGIAEVDGKGKPLLDLDSIDNAYMLFLCVRGYIYASMWISIPLLVSLRVSMALRRNKYEHFIFPIAAGAAASIGMSFAFYSVWAGWNPEPYTMLWLISTAFTMSSCDMCFERIRQDRKVAEASRAFPGFQMGGATPFPQLSGIQHPSPHVARTQT